VVWQAILMNKTKLSGEWNLVSGNKIQWYISVENQTFTLTDYETGEETEISLEQLYDLMKEVGLLVE